MRDHSSLSTLFCAVCSGSAEGLRALGQVACIRLHIKFVPVVGNMSVSRRIPLYAIIAGFFSSLALALVAPYVTSHTYKVNSSLTRNASSPFIIQSGCSRSFGHQVNRPDFRLFFSVLFFIVRFGIRLSDALLTATRGLESLESPRSTDY